jgi:hypothetical protein
VGETTKIFPLRAQSGIKRDTTDTEGQYWSQGLWTRFYRGLPRSMLGYRSMSEELLGPSRGLFVNPTGSGYINIFNGTADNLQVAQFTQAGVGSGQTDITPVGFAGSPNNVWQLDSIFNGNGGGLLNICAHGAPNLANIASNISVPVYYGDINGSVPLIAAVNDAVSPETFTIDGGILALPPFLIAYGSDGLYAWSDEDNPGIFPVANAANICAIKIVKGLSIRGGSTNPSALLWSLDSVIQSSFIGGSAIWDFNTLSDQSSILSSSGVVEKDGIYYWPGLDRFLVFNGVLQELPNELNSDFFYTNLNYAQRQKVFGFKIPRWGEICWCAPMFGATECNWMFVYNTREQTWYDTPLPTDGRSAAFFPQTWQYPVMASALGLTPIGQNSGTVFPLWQHEFGNDEVRGNQVNAIPKSIKSPALSMVGGGLSLFGSAAAQPDSVQTQMAFLEPDYLYNNSLVFEVLGRMFPQDTDTPLNTTTITKTGPRNFFDLQVQDRYLRWIISSNEQGGYFIQGQPLLHYRPGDHSP